MPKNIFLHGGLLNFVAHEELDKVYKIENSLYGLKGKPQALLGDLVRQIGV